VLEPENVVAAEALGNGEELEGELRYNAEHEIRNGTLNQQSIQHDNPINPGSQYTFTNFNPELNDFAAEVEDGVSQARQERDESQADGGGVINFVLPNEEQEESPPGTPSPSWHQAIAAKFQEGLLKESQL